MLEADAAWVAGLLEGEGCFTLVRPEGKSGRITVTCCMTDKDVIEKLREIVGCGHIYDRKPQKESWKPAWQWVVATRAEVVQLITELRPYMGRRRTERIDELIAFDRENPVSHVRYVHGTQSMFKVHGCRCDTCVSVKSSYDEGRRVKSPKRLPPDHGTHSKYVEGCRCVPCKQANTSAQREYRRKKREESVQA